MPAVLFDLDETLLNTRILKADRRGARWRSIANRLDEVTAYVHVGSRAQVTDLPSLTTEMGFQVGVLTQSPRWYAERLLDAFGIRYDALISGSDGYAPKPDPSSVRALAEELEVPLETCVVVGNDAADIQAAQNANVLCIGVAWSGRAPKSWRRHWPDIAIADPVSFLEALERPWPARPFVEATLERVRPLWHWGSLLHLGHDVFGAGRYYTRSDSRHPDNALSRLVIEAKNDQRAAERVAELLAGLTTAQWSVKRFDLVTSVPGKPGESADRFAAVRAALGDAIGARDRSDVLEQRFDDPDYKRRQAGHRLESVRGRFGSAALRGERVLLIDDVITSGGQSEECRRQMLREGARRVTILALGVTQSTLPRACPACGGTLRLVTKGRYGDFIGCANYFRLGCRYTEPAPGT